MTYGASALGRTAAGQVVFVDDALPGERVVAAVGMRKRRYLQARAEEILAPAPGRVAPPCPYVPECGGCQWQHATYETQVDMKRHVLGETLRRAGVIAPPADLIPADEALRYRIRGEFHIVPPDGANGTGTAAAEQSRGHRLGFNRRRSYQTVAVDDCLIHHPHIADALLGICRALDRTGVGAARSLRLTTHPVRRELLWEALGGPAPESLQDALQAELSHYLVQQDSLTLEYDGRLIDGRPGDPLIFRVDSASFVQVNHDQAHRLYGRALDYLGSSPGSLVEGYAGIGPMSILAATRADPDTRPRRIVLIEDSRPAALMARLHVRLHEVGSAMVLAGRVEDRLQHLEPEEVDTLLIDPPRAGCSPAVLDEIARLRPERVVYVSCDPATLARDLAGLADEGYRISAQTLVDMFPQTYHIETVTLLQREGP